MFSLASGRADWRQDVGWNMLQLYAGANLPNGSGITVEMAEALEASGDYMPNTNHSAFTAISFTNITDPNAIAGELVSGHATTVGLNYYSNTTSLLTELNTVGVRSADDFINGFLGTTGAVDTSTAAVMSHAYIGTANPSEEAALNEIIKRFDFFCQNSGVINVVGMNNGSSGTIPPLFGSSYNSISVGRTDGLHSHGSTPANYPGPGRQKPEIVSVASVNATSYATGSVSSAASLLYAKANLSGNANATHPDTIKACLMAGATKEEFPNWSQTLAKPLDTTYGAGELNIFHSYRIIEQTEASPGAVNFRGWSKNSVSTSSNVTYSFTTPGYITPMTISATLVWQGGVTETITQTAPPGQPTDIYTYAYQNLANLKLELLNQSGTPIQTSDSSLDNIEHIWNTQLEPNTPYSLRVSSSSGTAGFSLAWRVNGIARAIISVEKSGNNIDLSLSSLILSTQYIVQRSTDLSNWSDIHSFTAANSSLNWSDTTVPLGTSVFYRLFFFAP
jgi:hypothetical protein